MPYSDYNVIETKPGVTQRISASLYGGSATDAAGFSWNVDNSLVAEIAPAGQYCQLVAKNEGIAQISVTHPKSAVTYNILVYVFEDASKVTYITTTQNIVTCYTSAGEKTLGNKGVEFCNKL